MAINILYVENSPRDYGELKDAIEEYNLKESNEKLSVYRATNPDEMKGLLGPQFNVILADVYFDDPVTQKTDEKNRLDDIITYVDEWCRSQGNGVSIPIIAYTGIASLEECLERQSSLYDIWDKNTTTTKYVIWQLSNLAIEISKYQPDAFLQKLIREMPKGADWHEKVKDMTNDYDSGFNEYDQIKKVEESIGTIANVFDTEDICSGMWELMETSEAISRALSKNTRGHARHAVNVFWLGYYIINSDFIKPHAIEFWENIKMNRPGMSIVKDEEPIEAINNIWFYTGLFHDIGINVEKSDQQYKHQSLLIEFFEEFALPLPDIKKYSEQGIPDDIKTIIDQFKENSTDEHILKIFNESIKSKKPDHGLVAATYFINNLCSNETQKIYAKEAARATLLHNVLANDIFNNSSVISWENDFIASTLLLCDQLQTWDRERSNLSPIDDDKPERAELKNLLFDTIDGKCRLSIFIDYIAPSHIVRHPYHSQKLLTNLRKIIRTKPNRALKRIKKPWPFELYLNLTLGQKTFWDHTYN